ncbi:MAG TPA: DNA/RNA non-specific endonuclease [Flavobacterium sp.]|nr:DNA/RNA non-specific endonuclease [Flavobacterium sp.]
MKYKKTKPKSIYFYIGMLLMGIVLFALNKIEDNKNQQSIDAISLESTKDAKEIAFSNELEHYFYPTSTTGVVIDHENYTLSYSEAHEQAEWVAYRLLPEHLTDDKRKRPSFKQDPYITTESAKLSNYKNSGYSRGHLVPAGDRVFSKQAYDETFYTSNVSPQIFEFNAGVWNSLEVRVRNFVKANGGVFVVTGAVLSDGLKTIGDEKVSVPDYFYKIIFYENKGDYKMAAYLIPHNKIKKRNYKDFRTTTDSIEKLTGIDFFPTLDKNIQENLESKIDANWFE